MGDALQSMSNLFFSDYVPTITSSPGSCSTSVFSGRRRYYGRKTTTTPSTPPGGAGDPLLCPYLKYTWEFIEVFDKGTHKKGGMKENIDITAEEFKSWVMGRWAFPPEINMQAYDHPAMFPEELQGG
ncbi:MAG: hypothetical protein LUO93_10775 [Methanomicrobiales archaeon]|nr:hypothetical protein [Methanomicrobiales archaeon]